MATPQPQPQPCRPKSPACRPLRQPEPPLQVKVVGLFNSSGFQASKTIAETLKNNYPSRFEDPVIIPLQEFAWDQYLQEKKRELKGETWVYPSCVMCFINGQLLGNAVDLKKWAQKVWDVVDVRPSTLYEALTLNYSSKFLKDTKHDFVYLDICIDLSPIGRLVFELYCDTCPKTCKNFQVLCTGTAGFSERGIKLHYKDSIFHRVVRNGWIQGGGSVRYHLGRTWQHAGRGGAAEGLGVEKDLPDQQATGSDIVEGKGNDGESIYGPTFEDENFSVPHNKRGILGMVNKGRHTNASQFYVTLQSAPYLDKKYVAFGQLIEGTEVLKQLESVPTENERPLSLCRIADSGTLYT